MIFAMMGWHLQWFSCIPSVASTLTWCIRTILSSSSPQKALPPTWTIFDIVGHHDVHSVYAAIQWQFWSQSHSPRAERVSPRPLHAWLISRILKGLEVSILHILKPQTHLIDCCWIHSAVFGLFFFRLFYILPAWFLKPQTWLISGQQEVSITYIPTHFTDVCWICFVVFSLFWLLTFNFFSCLILETTRLIDIAVFQGD